MTRALQFALLAVLALLVAAPGAHASGKDVIRDCTDDEVMSKTYTAKEYRDALKELAADADQYGNCRDVILRAQRAALASGNKDKGEDTGGGGSNGGGGAIGSAPAAEQLTSATKRERKDLEQARAAPAGTVSLQNTAVDPAKVGTAPSVSQVADLPTPLAILLALLLVGTLAIGSLRIRRLVNARRA